MEVWFEQWSIECWHCLISYSWLGSRTLILVRCIPPLVLWTNPVMIWGLNLDRLWCLFSLEYIGVSDLNSHNTKKEYQGMAHGVESLAYDWVSKNLYWTDSQFKWIMAVDKDFLYYTPVYRSRYGDPHALTIHAKKRFVVVIIRSHN